jgi:hypothetical protein
MSNSIINNFFTFIKQNITMNIINQVYPSVQSKVILFTGLLVVFFFTKRLTPLRTTMAVLGVAVNAYLINCLVRGDCGAIAWLYVAMNMVGTYVIAAGVV